MPLSLHTLTGRTKAAQQDESDIGELYARMVIRTHETQHWLCTLIFSGVFGVLNLAEGDRFGLQVEMKAERERKAEQKESAVQNICAAQEQQTAADD